MFSTFIKVSNYKNMTAQSLYWFQFNLTKWLTHKVDGEGDIIRVHWAALDLNKTFLGDWCWQMPHLLPGPRHAGVVVSQPLPHTLLRAPPAGVHCNQPEVKLETKQRCQTWRMTVFSQSEEINRQTWGNMTPETIVIFEKNLFNLYLYKKDKE